MFQLLKPRTKLTTAITTRLFSGESQLIFQRPFTGGGKQSHIVPKQHVFTELFRLGPNATGKVQDVLHRIINSGKVITKFSLIDSLKDLRKLGRYQQCLEILEWIEKSRYKISSRDYALHLNILWRLKGIDEVEKYFDSIPSDGKDQSVYGALLYCYCSDLAIDKAEAVFKKSDELGYGSSVLNFGSLMSMYLKGGQPDKVPELIEEMKLRNIPLDGYTYSIWIQSYRLRGDIEGSEQVIHEAQENIKDDWKLHSNIAAVYTGFGQSEKAIQAMENLENVLDNANYADRDGYHHLISLYAGIGKLELVTRVWDKLIAKFKGGNNVSYLTMLQALSNLEDMENLIKYFQEWDASYKYYDERLPAVVIGAYLKREMVEEAELLLKDASRKAERLPRSCHIKFMNYYFEKRQAESALKHLAIAIAANWKPLAEKLDPCFQLFKEEKDVDGAEEFCRLLKKTQSLDAKGYLWLLQTYAAAEVTAPDMRQRIEEDGVNITPKLEDLLEVVCPI